MIMTFAIGLASVFVTNGSMTADKTFGSMTAAAPFDRNGKSGAWQLWETLADGRTQFGNPAAFNGVIAESSWISYTVTVKDPLFFDLMETFSGQPAGAGGLIAELRATLSQRFPQLPGA